MALKVWLPLNGKFDNQGCTDNNVIIDGSVPFANGKIGKAADFTSTNAANRVRVPGLELSVLSVCAWFMSSSASASGYIINEGRDYNTYGWGINVNNNKLYFRCSGQTLGVDILSNVWYHVCITCENGALKYYLNGILQGSYSKSSPNYSESNGYINIGAFGYSVNNTFIYPFNGYINDVRVYDEVLSDRQIREIAKGLCAHYKLEGVGANKNYLRYSDWSNKTNAGIYTFDGDEVTFSSSEFNASGNSFGQTMDTAAITDFRNKKITFSMEYNITEALEFGTTNPWVGFEVGVARNTTTGGSNQWLDWYGGKSIPTAVTNGWVYHEQTVTISDYDIASISISFYLRDTKGTIKYRHPKVEIGTVATPWIPNEADALYTKLGYDKALTTDVSGFGYNGTITGELTFDSDSPRYAGSTKFNGSSYITTTPGSLAWCNFDNLTISAWMKPTVKPGGWTGSIGIQQDGGTNGKVFSISNYAGNFSVHTDNGSGWVTTQSEALPLNQWSHCVATLTDGTNLKMYINGKLVKTATINYNTATVLSNTRIAIGADLPGDDEKYTGSYSDVRFYSTALSAEDILKLYEISGIIDNKGNTYSYEFIEED